MGTAPTTKWGTSYHGHFGDGRESLNNQPMCRFGARPALRRQRRRRHRRSPCTPRCACAKQIEVSCQTGAVGGLYIGVSTGMHRASSIPGAGFCPYIAGAPFFGWNEEGKPKENRRETDHLKGLTTLSNTQMLIVSAQSDFMLACFQRFCSRPSH